MKASETYAWGFTKPLTNESVIRCPDCKEARPLAEWEEGYVYCEACGDHAAMVCPRCGQYHDQVYADKFEVVV